MLFVLGGRYGVLSVARFPTRALLVVADRCGSKTS